MPGSWTTARPHTHLGDGILQRSAAFQVQTHFCLLIHRDSDSSFRPSVYNRTRQGGLAACCLTINLINSCEFCESWWWCGDWTDWKERHWLECRMTCGSSTLHSSRRCSRARKSEIQMFVSTITAPSAFLLSFSVSPSLSPSFTAAQLGYSYACICMSAWSAAHISLACRLSVGRAFKKRLPPLRCFFVCDARYSMMSSGVCQCGAQKLFC